VSTLFQDELNYLREVGREFAKLNPKLSKYLSDTASDPDVERLLEGFAFLTSKVREKIEDELPELTHSMMELLWPNFLRPFPSASMVRFTPNDRAITERKVIAAGTALRSRPIEGISCQFRTTADCIVYPLGLAEPRMERTRDRARLSLTFTTLSGQPANAIGLDTLRLTFTGDSAVAQTRSICGLGATFAPPASCRRAKRTASHYLTTLFSPAASGQKRQSCLTACLPSMATASCRNSSRFPRNSTA
jgi:type VI secretion system protein ImpG